MRAERRTWRAGPAENKIKVVSMRERADCKDAVAYLKGWIHSFAPPDSLSQFFTLERAHGVTARRPPLGLPPGPIVLKVLYFRDVALFYMLLASLAL